MGEDGRARAERLEQLDLHRRVGDVVLAAQDEGDTEVDVVDDAGEGVEVGAVLADQHGVREGRGRDVRGAAHAVLPGEVARIEAKAPVRTPSLTLQGRALLRGELEGGAVVGRWQAARELALAATVKLVGGLVARIQPAGLAQARGCGLIALQAVRLAHDEVGQDADPGEVLQDRVGILDARALAVGVVEAQDEAPALPGRRLAHAPVEERRA